jgi:hypothetical protein
MEDFTYDALFLISDDIGLRKVYDLKLRPRSWLTHGGTTVRAPVKTDSDYRTNLRQHKQGNSTTVNQPPIDQYNFTILSLQ